MANQNIPAIQVKESNVGIGTLSPLNKLSVSEGSFNLNATQASILNTNYGQKGHVVYDTLLIQQDDAPTIRLYEYLENASTTLSSDGGVSRLATTGILAFNVNGSSNSPGWNGLGGPEAMRIITNGYVGIGTTNPVAKLHVYSSGGGMELSPGSTTVLEFIDRSNTAATVNTAFYTRYGYFSWNIGGYSEAMRITGAGNVGIGTTSPYSRLSISNGNNTRTGLTLSDGDTASLMLFAGANAPASISFDSFGLRFVGGSTVGTDNGTEHMRITTLGKVGIGTTTPYTKLDVTDYTSFVSVSAAMPIESTTNNQAIAGIDFRKHYALAIGASIRQLQAGNNIAYPQAHLAFYTNDGSIGWNDPIERMRITASGNVGIGTTDPQGKLSVDGGDFRFNYGNALANYYFYLNHNGSQDGGLIFTRNNSTFDWQMVNVTGSGDLSFYSYGASSLAVTFQKSTGNVGIGTTSPSGKLSVLRPGINEGTISFVDANSNAHLFIGGSDAAVRLQMGTYNNGSYGAWIQASYDNGGSDQGTEPLILNPQGGNVGIGTTNPAAKLHVVSPDLGFTTGNTSYNALFYSYTGNTSFLEIKDVRTSNGSDWTSVGKRLQMRVDSTYMGYMQFNGNSNNYGISFGIGGTNTNPGNVDEAMRITSSGNVGIGTTSPATKLHVSGTIDTRIRLSDTGGSYMELYQQSTDSYVIVSNALRFYNGGSESIHIASSGNVGIGIAPSYKLQVNGNAWAVNYYIENSLGTAGTFRLDGYQDYLYFWGDSSAIAGYRFGSDSVGNVMQIGTNGRVGIGTTNPLAKLSVGNGSIADLNVPIQISSEGTGTQKWIGINKNGSYGLIIGYLENGGLAGNGAYIRQVTTDPLHFTVNDSTTAMSIVSSGNVGIGTASPDSALEINGRVSIRNANELYFGQSTSNIGSWTTRMYASGSTHLFNANTFIFNNEGYSSAEFMRITSAGNVGIGTTAPGAKLHVVGNQSILSGNGVGSFQVYNYQISTGNSISNNQVFDMYLGRFGNGYHKIIFWASGYGTDSGNYFEITTDWGGSTAPKILTNGGLSIGAASYTIHYVRYDYGSYDLFIKYTAGMPSGYANTINYNILSNTGSGYTQFTYASGVTVPTLNSSNLVSSIASFDYDTGRVGIGTTSPATILHTNTSSNVTFLGQSSSGSNTSYAYFQNAGSTSAYQVAFGSSTDDANIVAGGSERMRITAAGNAGIGTTSPGAKLEIYGSGSTGSTASLTVRNAVGTKLVNVFDDGLIQLNNLLNINQAIYINSGNSNRHYALESHIFNVVDSSFQRIDFVTIQGNLQSPAMGVGTMSPNSSAILDITSRSKGFLPPRMTNTEMNAISSPAAGLVVYDTSNNKLTVYNGSTWVPLH